MSDLQENKQELTENNTEELSASAMPKKKHGIGFYLKVFGVFFLCVLLSFAIAIFYVLNKLASDSNFEKLVNQKVSEAINMDVSFQKIGISFPSIELTNIHIATDSTDLKLDSYIASVKVRPDFLAALGGNVVIDYLGIASSSTLLELKAIKSTDKAVEVKEENNTPLDLSKITFPFKSLDISDIRLNLVDVGTNNNYNLVLNKANLSHSLVSSAMPYEISAELVNKASLNASGDLYWPSRVLSDVDLNLKDINEVKKYVPAEYQTYLKDITGSKVRCSLDYNINNNALVVKSYNVDVEPLVTVSGKADMPSISPLKLNVSANVDSLKTSEVWPLIKDYVPSEYGLALTGGTIGAEVNVGMDGDKPVEISAVAKPSKIEIATAFVPEKIVLQKGNISYDGSKVSVSDFEASLADTSVKLQSLSLSLQDFALDSSFVAKIGLEGLLKNLQPYLGVDLKRFDIAGDIGANGNIKGNLLNIASLRLNGDISSKNLKLSEKTVSAKGSIENLSVKLNDVGMECGTINIENIKATAVGASLVVKGLIKNQKDIGFDCAATGNINVGEFSKLAASLFGLAVKENQYKGNLDVDLKLGGSVKNPKPSGKIIAKDICADVSDYGMLIENFNGNVIADSNKLVLNGIKANIFGGSMDFNGTFSDFNKMKVEAVANVKNTDLAAVRKMIGAFVPEMEEDLKFGGKADLNASLSGLTSVPKVKGSALLTDASFEHPAVLRPIEKINGRINFDNNGLNSDSLVAYWGTSKANVSGNLKDWAKFITNFKFSVAPLDVTDISGFFLNGSGYEVIGSGIGSGTVTGALEKIKVNCVASVDVGTVTALITEGGEAMKFPFSQLKANAVFFDNTLDISSASLKLFDGDIGAKAKVFIASDPIKFEVDANINQLMTQEFLKVNTDPKYHKTLEGGLDGTASLKGDVTGLNSINGTARLAMKKGSYDSPDVIKKIADKLKNPSLASGTIENVSGDYTIADGKISSNNAMGKYKDSKVMYRGSIALDTTLDGALDFELGKETCETGYMKELLGNSDVLKLTCKVKGSLTSPNIDLPLSDIAKKSAMNEVNKILEKNNLNISNEKFKDKAEKAVEKVSDKLGDVGSKLGKGLKKLFK